MDPILLEAIEIEQLYKSKNKAWEVLDSHEVLGSIAMDDLKTRWGELKREFFNYKKTNKTDQPADVVAKWGFIDQLKSSSSSSSQTQNDLYDTIIQKLKFIEENGSSYTTTTDCLTSITVAIDSAIGNIRKQKVREYRQQYYRNEKQNDVDDVDSDYEDDDDYKAANNQKVKEWLQLLDY